MQVACAGREVERGLLMEEQNLPEDLELAPPGTSASERQCTGCSFHGRVRKTPSGLPCSLEILRLLGWALLMPVSEQKRPFQELYPIPTTTRWHKYFGINVGK